VGHYLNALLISYLHNHQFLPYFKMISIASSILTYDIEHVSLSIRSLILQAIDIILKYGRNWWLCKYDISNAFKNCPITPSQWPMFCVKWKSLYYFYVRLTFGCKYTIWNQSQNAYQKYWNTTVGVSYPSDLKKNQRLGIYTRQKSLKIPKVLIRVHKSKKNRQHNGQKKKYKRTNNDLHNIHLKLKIKAPEFTPGF
jgi:hypothetical protein